MLSKIVIILVFFSTVANASCNFITAEFISELGDPKSIKKIDVIVAKSSKFNQNFAEILVSKSRNILPKFKKNFNAKIKVHYDFGLCIFDAKVRQLGDWKDHIKLIDGGKPVRSLRVKLKNGNILNSVAFNLLIPETRNDMHEVLGTIILRKLNYIAPETFQVLTDVNGAKNMMLFQEETTKELLEKNKRREGPMFEADESIIWTSDGFDHDREKLSLARNTNPKWFLKGKNSSFITLHAYSLLQKTYLDYSQKIELQKRNLNLFENSETYREFIFTLLAMNGLHGLRPHNQKFYYNSFTESFEPIYYDGNLDFFKPDPKVNMFNDLIVQSFSKNYKYKFSQIFDNKNLKDEIFKSFNARTRVDKEDSELFFEKSMKSISANIEGIKLKINQNEYLKENIDHDKNFKSYSRLQKKFSIDQNILFSLKLNEEKIKANSLNGDVIFLDNTELSKIISRLRYKDRRYVYLPKKINQNFKHNNNTRNLKFLDGEILFSKNLSVEIDENNRIINFFQNTSKDWVLIKNLNLEEWKINFFGKNNLEKTDIDLNIERINENGLTGCLNFFNINFKNVSIIVENGECEDSLNIVNSKGLLNEIKITNAFSDGLDIDFSDIEMKSLKTNKAGNDCLDLSFGNYILSNAELMKCNDKGISVGEKSKLIVKNSSVKNSSIGVSVKDLSEVILTNSNFLNNSICVESVKKKQEFGGGKALLEKINCEGEYVKDNNSIISHEF